MMEMIYDCVIAGGGPGGLSAALTLGRARRRVLLCDFGAPRNAATVHMHNFVTRDGVTPAEFRRIAREQLATYPHVDVRDVRVEEIRGEAGAFDVRLSEGRVRARRILLCTGMIDELPEIEGLRACWGRSIFICPYCHAWEVQDRRFAYLATNVEKLGFALLLRAWTSDVVVLTDGKLVIPPDMRAQLNAGGVRVEERSIARLIHAGDQLQGIEFADGESLPREVLFVHPRQRHADLVTSLGLKLDAMNFVEIDAMRQTSRPGIYAGGDLVSGMQGAVIAAASGSQAAATLNHALVVELATSSWLP
jgi:thioredoxin reductase